MLVAARASFFISRAKRWTNPYVADGLVAMWDGEWNAGGGVHDPHATTWKNLVDGSSFGNGVSAASYPPVWGTDYCRNPSGVSGQKQVFSVAASAAAAQSVACAEEVGCAVSVSSYVDGSWNCFQRFSVGVHFFRSSAVLTGGVVALWPSGKYQPWRAFNNSINALTPFTRRAYHTKLAPSDKMYLRMNNGTEYLLARGNGSTMTIPATYPLLSAHSCVLECCCIRLYSRTLTAAEIAANYAIDKARFNLS